MPTESETAGAVESIVDEVEDAAAAVAEEDGLRQSVATVAITPGQKTSVEKIYEGATGSERIVV